MIHGIGQVAVCGATVEDEDRESEVVCTGLGVPTGKCSLLKGHPGLHVIINSDGAGFYIIAAWR